MTGRIVRFSLCLLTCNPKLTIWCVQRLYGLLLCPAHRNQVLRRIRAQRPLRLQRLLIVVHSLAVQAHRMVARACRKQKERIRLGRGLRGPAGYMHTRAQQWRAASGPFASGSERVCAGRRPAAWKVHLRALRLLAGGTPPHVRQRLDHSQLHRRNRSQLPRFNHSQLSSRPLAPQEAHLDALHLLVGGADAAVQLPHRPQVVAQALQLGRQAARCCTAG